MKDVIHHRKYTQRKVIQETRKLVQAKKATKLAKTSDSMGTVAATPKWEE